MDDGLNRLRFEPDLERAFIEHHARRSRSIVRVFFGIAGLIAIIGGIAHLANRTSDLDAFSQVALGLVAPICILIFLSTFAKFFAKVVQPLVTAGMAGIGGGLLYVWTNYPDQGFFYYGSLSIVLLTPLVYTVSRLRFYWAVAAAWSLMAAYYYCANRVGLSQGLAAFQPAYVLMSNLFSMVAGYYLERATRRDFLLTQMLEAEKQRSEALLANVLPDHVAARLKNESSVIADYHEDVFVLFADIADFTRYAANHSPEDLVIALDRVFTEFDHLAESLGLEKIKTIGDAYMAVTGLPEPKPDDAERIIRFALQLNKIIPQESDFPFEMRIGIHCGPVVAGVIGKRKLVYDLWGDTVNTASRMESTGEPGMIHMSEEVARRVAGKFDLVDRGVIKIKGKGALKTYALYLEKPTSPVRSLPLSN